MIKMALPPYLWPGLWPGTLPRAGINDGQTMDNSWINASSREFTVSGIGCAYRAELILGKLADSLLIVLGCLSYNINS